MPEYYSLGIHFPHAKPTSHLPLQLLKQLNSSLFRLDMMENLGIKQRNSALPTINRNGFESPDHYLVAHNENSSKSRFRLLK
jgi:hypothetical protein